MKIVKIFVSKLRRLAVLMQICCTVGQRLKTAAAVVQASDMKVLNVFNLLFELCFYFWAVLKDTELQVRMCK
jgi:hypothetical protein